MDILIGERDGWGDKVPFGLSIEDRRRHMHIVGQTGSGKSTLLRNLIIQDIEAGRGCMLLDPHGDLAEELLDYIPPWRTEDVIYFAPADLSHPIGLNLLDPVPPDDRPLVASNIVSVFHHLWADSWGPRLEYILYNTLVALLEFPSSAGAVSLLGVPRMFTDTDYREKIVRMVRDPRIKNFWEAEFPGFSPSLRAEAVSPIQNKVGQLLAAPAVRNVLGQRRSTIRLREAMDGRKILIANLAKARLGEDKGNLLGSFLLTSMQLAALQRADSPEKSRVDFACYLDEAHNYTTNSFATILSEARKYRLALITAGQYMEQLPQALQAAIFGNVGTLVSFRVGHADADVLSAELAPFSAETLRDLRRGEVCVRLTADGEPSQPVLGRTMQSEGWVYGRRQILIDQSRRRYGRRREVVEECIERWSRPSNSNLSAPLTAR